VYLKRHESFCGLTSQALRGVLNPRERNTLGEEFRQRAFSLLLCFLHQITGRRVEFDLAQWGANAIRPGKADSRRKMARSCPAAICHQTRQSHERGRALIRPRKIRRGGSAPRDRPTIWPTRANRGTPRSPDRYFSSKCCVHHRSWRSEADVKSDGPNAGEKQDLGAADPKEGVQLIRAFLKINDPSVRQKIRPGQIRFLVN
jgi:hypothetical protein